MEGGWGVGVGVGVEYEGSAEHLASLETRFCGSLSCIMYFFSSTSLTVMFTKHFRGFSLYKKLHPSEKCMNLASWRSSPWFINLILPRIKKTECNVRLSEGWVSMSVHTSDFWETKPCCSLRGSRLSTADTAAVFRVAEPKKKASGSQILDHNAPLHTRQSIRNYTWE